MQYSDAVCLVLCQVEQCGRGERPGFYRRHKRHKDRSDSCRKGLQRVDRLEVALLFLEFTDSKVWRWRDSGRDGTRFHEVSSQKGIRSILALPKITKEGPFLMHQLPAPLAPVTDNFMTRTITVLVPRLPHPKAYPSSPQFGIPCMLNC